MRKLVERLLIERDVGGVMNLIKLHLSQPKISLLSYPEFDTVAHPSLACSITIDFLVGRAKETSYSKSVNPPILHRKESFLAPGDPRIEMFAKLTRKEEEAGLYEETKTIGFKQNWERLLESKGVRIDGHSLIRTTGRNSEGGTRSEIEREKTALKRYELSRPVKMLLECGVLLRGESFFDYGCGLGSDVKGLQGLGYESSGWDPHHAPEIPFRKADVVNLGFVLNVIEDPAERIEVLSRAWSLASKALLVSTIIGKSDAPELSGERYSDGVRTKLNTFQKYFDQAELQGLIEHTLEADAIPAGPCMFVVFRRESDAQDFLSTRYRRRIDWESLSLRLGLGRPIQKERRPRLTIYEKHKELLDDYWGRLLDLGRQPKESEFDRISEVRKACGPIPRAMALFEDRFGSDTMEAAREQRREDILVYLASSQFKKRVPFKEYSEKLQNDIRTFFGGYELAIKKATELLFAAGDPGEIELACEKVPFGWHTEEHFTFHSPLLDRLPAILRIYVACGTTLYGNPKEADLIKIHKLSRKLTLMHYQGFTDDPFPELKLRIKIDLRRMFVNVFDHSEGPEHQILFFKERFTSDDFEGIEKLAKLSEKLASLGIVKDSLGENDRFAPSKEKFQAFLDSKSLTWGLNKKRSGSN
ncbi:DNA phosphorothioation-associated putative methyltransferase [Pelagicoccus sp. SDUM812003]|uniref:DNA phosphorothioation-associated putative methyltransferase n=1 Tax=Pelagicoccus sp. SDUM812003 TaxID=3041267 RepID=UPI00280FFC04|nr:DNA phosphorothioation-associated putative methyltransferase [Pelagicoccus sp. SDUM812003]MDQ8203347.1 DNA phosphorothioation-associated putative methyltransferase [Pelagicoccus sp. SDUM812003]